MGDVLKLDTPQAAFVLNLVVPEHQRVSELWLMGVLVSTGGKNRLHAPFWGLVQDAVLRSRPGSSWRTA
jgi:hypothetical protein